MEAILRFGSPVMVPYTPSGADVAAGQIITSGNKCFIAHEDITDGVTGEVAVGGGVYEMIGRTGVGQGIDLGDKVYWNGTAAVETAGTAVLGWAAETKAAASGTFLVEHGSF